MKALAVISLFGTSFRAIQDIFQVTVGSFFNEIETNGNDINASFGAQFVW